ncbi:MAG: hypothetical protein JW827_05540 [Spirochaetes bacterium]|nr:hypothetical protein [Spirochaetota bacterium]
MNHYIPSGWMGDWGDIYLNEMYKENPHSGKTCIKIIYSAEKKQKAGWSGIYWQNPPNNWGYFKGGYDLTGAKRLYFYARGEEGEEYVEFKMGGIIGKYSDTTMGNKTGAIKLSRDWKLYGIDLEGYDLKYISGGFCAVFSSQLNTNGCTFYLDEVYYTDKEIPQEFDSLLTSENKIEKAVLLPIMINTNKKLLRIGVLSFENTSKSHDLEYLSKTIPESISTFLGKQNELKVIDWESVQQKLNALSLSMEDFNTLNGEMLLGKILKVDTLIRGSFVEVNNKIRINTKLIDISSGTIITSDQIEGDLNKDVFLLMDKTSQTILGQISNFNKTTNE